MSATYLGNNPRTAVLEQKTARMQASIQVRRPAVRGAQDDRLAGVWERLHAEAEAASVFNSWSYQRAWLRCYGKSRVPYAVVTRSGDRITGALAFTIEETRIFGVPVRVARLTGNGGDTHPDDLGPVMARGEEGMASRALARALLELREFDVLDFNDIDERSIFPAAVAEVAGEAKMRCVVQPAQRLPYVDLPLSWDAYRSSLSGDRRWQMGRRRRRLAEAFPTRFLVWRERAGLPGIVSLLARFHRARWGAASEAFATPTYNALQLDMMEHALAHDWLRLYCLEIAGTIAAILYCYRFRNRIFLVQAGFDVAYARWSPGAVLLGHALEHAIHEGNQRFDFLRGQHAYKEELATGVRHTVRVSAFRPTLGALAYRVRGTLAGRRRTLHALLSRLRGAPC